MRKQGKKIYPDKFKCKLVILESTIYKITSENDRHSAVYGTGLNMVLYIFNVAHSHYVMHVSIDTSVTV